jgi:hypothetical protein
MLSGESAVSERGNGVYRISAKTHPARLRPPPSLRLRRKEGLENLLFFYNILILSVQAPLYTAGEERVAGAAPPGEYSPAFKANICITPNMSSVGIKQSPLFLLFDLDK